MELNQPYVINRPISGTLYNLESVTLTSEDIVSQGTAIIQIPGLKPDEIRWEAKYGTLDKWKFKPISMIVPGHTKTEPIVDEDLQSGLETVLAQCLDEDNKDDGGVATTSSGKTEPPKIFTAPAIKSGARDKGTVNSSLIKYVIDTTRRLFDPNISDVALKDWAHCGGDIGDARQRICFALKKLFGVGDVEICLALGTASSFANSCVTAVSKRLKTDKKLRSQLWEVYVIVPEGLYPQGGFYLSKDKVMELLKIRKGRGNVRADKGPRG